MANQSEFISLAKDGVLRSGAAAKEDCADHLRSQ
jgi:hypothetical protein